MRCTLVIPPSNRWVNTLKFPFTFFSGNECVQCTDAVNEQFIHSFFSRFIAVTIFVIWTPEESTVALAQETHDLVTTNLTYLRCRKRGHNTNPLLLTTLQGLIDLYLISVKRDAEELASRFCLEWRQRFGSEGWMGSRGERAARQQLGVCVVMWTVTQCFHSGICQKKRPPTTPLLSALQTSSHSIGTAGSQSISNVWDETVHADYQNLLITDGQEILVILKADGFINILCYMNMTFFFSFSS